MNLFPFIQIYTDNIYLTGRQPAFVMMLAFLITFIITRAYTRIARHTGWGSASFGGVHTHHLVFGLVIALFSGALQFAFLPEPDSIFNLLNAIFFGIGSALILDEFALIFHLEDVYWEKEGRKSVDAVVIAFMFGMLFLLHTTPLVKSDIEATGTALLIAIGLNFIFVLISALKGKIFMASFGAFIPTLAQIGAIRLAEPDSIWAREFYKKDSRKMKRSTARYKRYEKKWRPRKEQLWDIIGGKTGRPLLKVKK